MGGALCRSVPAWPQDGLFDAERPEIVSEKVERSSPSAVAPPQNLCPDGSVGCQEAAPTMVIVIAGLCVMLFLIAVALVLLFYSYYKYRRQTRRLELVHENESVTSVTIDGDEVSSEADENYDGVLLVLMPGEEEPLYFARRNPLFEDEAVVREVVDAILGTVIVGCEQQPESDAQAVLHEINRVLEELVAESSVAITIQEDLNREKKLDNRDEAERLELAVVAAETDHRDEFLDNKLEPNEGVNREEDLNNRDEAESLELAVAPEETHELLTKKSEPNEGVNWEEELNNRDEAEKSIELAVAPAETHDRVHKKSEPNEVVEAVAPIELVASQLEPPIDMQHESRTSVREIHVSSC